MFEKVNQKIEKLRNFTQDVLARATRSKYAEAWLAAVAFTESSFFLLPPDLILIPMVVARTQTWIRYVTLTTLMSVLGGLFGYAIGAIFFDLFGDKLISLYGAGDQFAQVQVLFRDNTFWTIFVSAFTPIPYKVFTITAGVVGVNIPIFIIASLLGRGLRYLILGFVFKLYGAVMGKTIFKHFNTFLMLVVVGIGLYIWAHIW